MSFGSAAALGEPQICYILGRHLVLCTGIILTVLYCRIKYFTQMAPVTGTGTAKPNADESIYTGLTRHATDTYETIGQKKKGLN
ncbi:hypothetical protein J4Q44_G00055800 [Coregonus suidteri]|uniref:Uncharacterized protein n=1 Tax=Coregonus suidteri TaxID=861788 RepID=A0AAN8R398_9TELE